MDEAENILKLVTYYRNSIADGEKKESDYQKFGHENEVGLNEMVIGQLSENITEYLFQQNYNHDSKKLNIAMMKNWKIKVILCPLVMNVNAYHGKEIELPERAVPLMIPAVLDTTGKLSHDKTFPWIARKLLKPSKIEEFSIGELDVLDHYLSKNKLPKHEDDWQEFWAYAANLLHTVTGYIIENFMMKHYTNSDSSYVILNDSSNNATIHLTKFYDNLIKVEKMEFGKLAKKIMSIKCRSQSEIKIGKELFEESVKHLGQMGQQFPLSESQRESMNYFTDSENGEVFAVNGPPGTGKTTLLHSIISQQYVVTALKKSPPPFILATSNNNQAVTNIIDSFAKVFDAEDILGQRWLPEVNSFGTYLVSSKRYEEESKSYQVITEERGKLKGFINKLESKEYTEKAKSYFIDITSKYFNQQIKGLKEAIDSIHTNLSTIVKEINTTMEKVINLQEIKNKVLEQYSIPIKEYLKKLNEDLVTKELELEENQALKQYLKTFFKSLSILKKIYSITPILSFVVKSDYEIYIKTQAKLYSNQVYPNYYSIRSFIKKNNQDITKIIIDITYKIQNVEKDIQKVDDINDQLVEIGLKYNDNLEYTDDIQDKINEAIDTTLRYQAFRLSTHYYEGVWLEDTINNLRIGNQDKKTHDKRKNHWRRIAHLTPCFVSTFYMIPKFLETGEFVAGEWKTDYLYEFIDLLIVDEAGQASPEVCLPLFTLAKKAIIVGDVLQIEPVWSIEEITDEPNFIKYTGINDMEVFLMSGLSASKGNLMQVAKNSSRYEKYGEGGMYLREHRRCVPEIIEYCNELAYNGKLKPMRKNDTVDYPYCHLGHINIHGQSDKVSGSRRNKKEAQSITDWIVDNTNRILGYYNSDNIKDLIAVVTPFKAQARTIKAELKKYKGLEEITVGTVHSLQGAERKIIIFSSVYTKQDQTTFFIDKDINMLNVAVSRAQDAFIVIGDERIFNSVQDTPTGILARHLEFNMKTKYDMVTLDNTKLVAR